MNEKFFVPFTTAQRLKEFGYNEPSTMVYNILGELWSMDSTPRRNESNDIRQRVDINHITAPTYHEVLSWLEGKGVVVCADKVNGFWYAMLVYTDDYDACEASDIQHSREQALNYGINCAMDYLQKGGRE